MSAHSHHHNTSHSPLLGASWHGFEVWGVRFAVRGAFLFFAAAWCSIACLAEASGTSPRTVSEGPRVDPAKATPSNKNTEALPAESLFELSLLELDDLPQGTQLPPSCLSPRRHAEQKNLGDNDPERSPLSAPRCELGDGARARLAQGLLERYSLPADLTMQAEMTVPVGWVDPHAEPQRFLGVGAPVRLKRVPAALVLPFFSLPELVYFQGGSEVISQLNAAVDYLSQGKFEESLNVLDKAVESKKNEPAGDHERMTLHLVRGYLRLLFFAGKAFGQPSSARQAGIWKALARDDFRDGILLPSLYAYASKMDASVDPALYTTGPDAVFYLDPQLSMPQRPRQPGAPKRSLAPVTWIRSVAPWALLNLVNLSREQGYFSMAFNAADRLEDLYEELAPSYRQHDPSDRESYHSVLSSDKVPRLGKTRFIRPGGLDDAMALSEFMRAEALQKQHLESLMHTDKATRLARSSELKALGFEMMGRIYYDLQHNTWARRLFAWSELLAPQLLAAFPDALVWGAEASLWRGLHARSYRGFTRARDDVSDREYGAAIELRLLQLERLAGQSTEAARRLEYLRTHYAGPRASPIAADVQTLDFCLHALSLSPRVRRVEYERTQKAIGEVRMDLREHAAACFLAADLEDAKRRSQERRHQDSGLLGQQVRRDAAEQEALIQAFSKEYPDSPFQPLFKAREREVALGVGFGMLADNDCPQVLTFFSEHQKALLDSQRVKSPAVAGLVWSPKDSDKVMRCAATHNRRDLWNQAQRSVDLPPNALRDNLLAWHNKKSDAALLALRATLMKERGWGFVDTGLAQADALVKASLDRDDFWALLSLREVLASEPKEPAHVFFDEPLQVVLTAASKGTNQFALGSQLCSWAQKALRAPGQVGIKRMTSFASSPWLSGVSIKGGLSLGDPSLCLTRLTAKVLSRSAAAPSPWSDDSILWPFVEKIAVLPRADLALDLARRTFERTGEASDEVVGVFSRVAEQAQDSSLREQARVWLRQYVLRQPRKVW